MRSQSDMTAVKLSSALAASAGFGADSAAVSHKCLMLLFIILLLVCLVYIYVFDIYMFGIFVFGFYVFGFYVFGFYVFLCLMFGGCYCHDSRFISLPGQPFWFAFAIVSLRRFTCHPVCKI